MFLHVLGGNELRLTFGTPGKILPDDFLAIVAFFARLSEKTGFIARDEFGKPRRFILKGLRAVCPRVYPGMVQADVLASETAFGLQYEIQREAKTLGLSFYKSYDGPHDQIGPAELLVERSEPSIPPLAQAKAAC